MDYALAKQLKDAGFPQEGVGGWSITVNEIKVLVQNGEDIEEYKKNNCYYYPTLSELIAACGDEFDVLRRVSKEEWKCGWIDYMSDLFHPQSVGKTSEEAVANLYLALKGKEPNDNK